MSEKKASKKKTTPKPKAAPKPKGPSKASLTSELNALGIPIPEGALIADLNHRKKHWLPGDGWLVRMYRQHPALKRAGMLPGKMYWLPNSRWAEEMIKTKKLTVIRRMRDPPGKAIALDVPEGWNGSL